jgi:hypothetical protein
MQQVLFSAPVSKGRCVLSSIREIMNVKAAYSETFVLAYPKDHSMKESFITSFDKINLN